MQKRPEQMNQKTSCCNGINSPYIGLYKYKKKFYDSNIKGEDWSRHSSRRTK